MRHARTLVAAALLGSALSAQSPLCTAFAGTTIIAPGVSGTVYFDVTVLNASDLLIDALDVNTATGAGASVTVDVYITAAGGTFAGNESTPGAWTLVGSGTGPSAGADAPTFIDVAPNFLLTTGQSYGVAVHYTNADPLFVAGSGATINSYQNADLRIDLLGSVSVGAAGVGAVYSPYNFQGCFHYAIASGILPDFAADKSYCGPSETVNFMDLSFTSDPGGISAWSWDFDNDGTPDAFTQNASWIYTTCGPKTVALTVTDANGFATETKVDYVTVGAPIADFDISVMGAMPVFTATVTDTSGAVPTSWEWDFDNDGITDSTMQSPGPWPYLTDDLQPITLTVTNACGSDSITKFADTRTKLCSPPNFVSDNGGGDGGGVFFDVDVLNPAGVTVRSIDVNSGTPGTALTIDVYTRSGTYVGRTQSAAGWTLVATGSGTSAGFDVPSTMILDNPLCLRSGITGVAIVIVGAGHNYTNGTGTNQSATNADMTINLGAAMNTPFNASAGVFSPRIANICLGYQVGVDNGTWTQFANGCPNSSANVADLQLADGSGAPLATPVANGALRFQVTGGPASTNTAVHISFAPVVPAVPLSLIGAPPGCDYHADATVTLAFATDATGFGSAPQFTIPFGALGIDFYTQAFFADLALITSFPLPVTASNAYQGRASCP